MKRPCPTALAAITLVATLLLAPPAQVFAQKGSSKPPPSYPYKFTNLGQVGYNNFSGGAKAYGIAEPSAEGELLAIGGGISTPSPAFASVWEATATGSLLSAGVVPDSRRGSVAVNDAGMIAYEGYSASRGDEIGIVDVPGVGIVEIPFFHHPTALNNLGQVVGRDVTFNGVQWTVGNDGTLSNWVSLGDFIPFAINDWGEMAGQLGSSAAIAWFEEGVLEVRTLPGLFSGDFGRATGTNNFGEVVGVSATNGTNGALTGSYRPFLWRSTTGTIGLAAGGHGAALDINDFGEVVGWSSNSKGYYAFLWSSGQLSDLNALSGVGTSNFRLGSAESINNAGQIVGRSDMRDRWGTASGSFLLTPKP